MIGYRISLADLQARIGQNWLERAKERTDEFRNLGRYEEKSPFWSEVKPRYMELQHEKCAFCERKLESVKRGAIEQDIEHFRPKSSVKAWKPPKDLAESGITFSQIPAGDTGYYLLPYHPFNYSAACKPCNSILKKDYFPIGGKHAFAGDDPVALLKENPYLLYPIGDFDTPPEELLEFNGISPCPTETAIGHARNRVLVTIAFFELDSQARKNLLKERARCLVALYPQLHILQDPASSQEDRADARQVVDAYISDDAPHANCSRSFKRLYEKDRELARAMYKAALKLIAKSS